MGLKDLETPHIDTLAKNGVVFSNAHVSSTVCAPPRAGLILQIFFKFNQKTIKNRRYF